MSTREDAGQYLEAFYVDDICNETHGSTQSPRNQRPTSWSLHLVGVSRVTVEDDKHDVLGV